MSGLTSTTEKVSHNEGGQRDFVSVIIVAHAAAAFLPTCLSALRQQTYTRHEVILVDTTPFDAQTAAVVRRFPEVYFIAAPTNLGYAGGNNLGVAHARGALIAILNPDTEPTPTWLAALVEALTTFPTAGLVTSKIVFFDRRDTINTYGNDVHITGLATCHGLEEPSAKYMEPLEVAAVSGAAFLVRKALFIRLGGFDERFFMYMEDTDLSWRAYLQGFTCVAIPESIVAHHYRTSVTPQKLFHLERNRIVMLIHNLHYRTIFLLSPAFALIELLTWAFALLRGWDYLCAKARTYRWLLHHRHSILNQRRRVQQTRIVADAAILTHFGYQLHIDQLSSPLLAIPLRLLLEPFFHRCQRAIISLTQKHSE